MSWLLRKTCSKMMTNLMYFMNKVQRCTFKNQLKMAMISKMRLKVFNKFSMAKINPIKLKDFVINSVL